MTILETLRDIQKNLKAPKNQRNNFGNYNYRSTEDILEAVKPLLKNCVLTITDTIENIGGENYIKATATLRDNTSVISTSAYAKEAHEQKGMAPAQITGSTSSYARKYCLNGLFLIDDSKDDDATNQHGKEEVLKATPPPAKSQKMILKERITAEAIKLQADVKIPTVVKDIIFSCSGVDIKSWEEVNETTALNINNLWVTI